MNDVMINALGEVPHAQSEARALAQRPYIATAGPNRGHSVVAYHTGQFDGSGKPVYGEKRIHSNATLRKDEWIQLDNQVLESARERLVIVDDMREAGLTHNAGGLGTIVSEWETSSEMTDADVTMDGESKTDKDDQEFGLQGVPIPVIQKPFTIGERMLMSSRQRGADLETTKGVEAGRAIARTSEKLVFYGSKVSNVNSAGDKYSIPGLTTFGGRATASISDWDDDDNVTPEDIDQDILALVAHMEKNERHFGPFNLYIPAEYARRFREDYKDFGTRSLMDVVEGRDVIARVRVSDVLNKGDVVMVQMERTVLDLAMAADLTTVQWESGSGWTNNFQSFAAWAPRLKQDFDGHSGIMHATVGE